MSDERRRDTMPTVVDGPAAAASLPTRVVAHDQTVHCGVPSRAGRSDMPPSRAEPFGQRYVDEGEIAKGGMGSIKRVLDLRMLRGAAMKLFDSDSKQDALRFLEEAQITGQLDHPNVVPVYDLTVDDDGMPCNFTMKLVEGATLSQLIDDPERALSAMAHSGPITSAPRSAQQLEALRLERLLRVIIRVCEAVDYAHSRGVIHRDLKPSNIMVGEHGEVYVMDWGVARLLTSRRPSESKDLRRHPHGQSREEPGMVIGTVSYMAPEQAEGDINATDERTDVFGLGAVLYKILTGRPPHHGERTWAEAHQLALACEIKPPQDVLNRPLPPRICEVTMKALAKDPQDRFQTVNELREALEDFLRGGGWFASATFPRGSIIVAQGDVGDRAYIIRAGSCEVYCETADGRHALGTLGPGDVFGEMAILTDSMRNACVQALTDVEALIITRDALDRELERNEWLAIIMRAVAERFRGIQPNEELAILDQETVDDDP